MISVDLNADIGESFGNYSTGNDSMIMDFISSANIACGFHAGDPVVIAQTVRMAVIKGVAIGAHPGYPDLQGFGRRSMALSASEVYDYVLYQVGALKSIAESEGGKLSHVKAHGALYNDAVRNRELAEAIIGASKALDSSLVIYGLPNSEIENATLRNGMRFALEAFADRAYYKDGTLVPRKLKDSVISDITEVSDRVEGMVLSNRIKTYDGGLLIIRPDTVCLHGDNMHAVEIAREINTRLSANGIEIKSL
ncbi:MAG: LamB/YcsF family protein [Bacteroidia bacterium]|nr:MAG: LamB/YcsF family protein [Bacteroidia bacterium]